MRSGPDIAAPRTTRVWDPLVRVFHWTVVACFGGAYLFQDPRALHEAFGYTLAGALAIRLFWGIVGTRYARFSDFVPGPARFLGYVRDIVGGRERRYLGHNPAGGAMVVALMTMLALTAATGWYLTTDAGFGEDSAEALHALAANVTLGLVAAHLCGVLWESLRHRENLVLAMITGRKRM